MTMLESKLLPTLSSIGKFTARDAADLCFLYFIALHTLRSNIPSEAWARHYANQTKSSYYAFSTSSTDLHQLISVLLEHRMDLKMRLKHQEHSKDLFELVNLDDHTVQSFLNNVQAAHYNTSLAAQLLMKLEHQLNIATTNYRSVRRICGDWNRAHVSDEAKSLAITRLIQALEKRARTGDILPQLKKLANYENLLLKNVCNPETGTNCEEAKPRLGLLKQLAIATGIGVGAFMLGRALAKGMNE